MNYTIEKSLLQALNSEFHPTLHKLYDYLLGLMVLREHVWLSNEDLAKQVGIKKRQVQRLMKRLVSMGLITKYQKYGNRSKNTIVLNRGVFEFAQYFKSKFESLKKFIFRSDDTLYKEEKELFYNNLCRLRVALRDAYARVREISIQKKEKWRMRVNARRKSTVDDSRTSGYAQATPDTGVDFNNKLFLEEVDNSADASLVRGAALNKRSTTHKDNGLRSISSLVGNVFAKQPAAVTKESSAKMIDINSKLLRLGYREVAGTGLCYRYDDKRRCMREIKAVLKDDKEFQESVQAEIRATDLLLSSHPAYLKMKADGWRYIGDYQVQYKEHGDIRNLEQTMGLYL